LEVQILPGPPFDIYPYSGYDVNMTYKITLSLEEHSDDGSIVRRQKASTDIDQETAESFFGNYPLTQEPPMKLISSLGDVLGKKSSVHVSK
jgi:hypothetical protein